MDQIKLIRWKERFTATSKELEIEYNSFFSSYPLGEAFTIALDESDQWELVIKEDVPKEIRTRFQEIFLASKPEDSI